MDPLVEALFMVPAGKAIGKAGEKVDEALVNLPSDTDALIKAPDLLLERRRANRALRELKIDCLENLDKLSVICRALWTLIRQNCNLSEDELKNRIPVREPQGKRRIRLRPGADISPELTDTLSEAPRSFESCQQLTTGLGEKMERLAQISRAIWELLHEIFGFSDEELLNKVTELDLRDGKLDGKITTPAKKCSKCGRVVSRSRMKCLYCGEENLLDSAFDSLTTTGQLAALPEVPEGNKILKEIWGTIWVAITGSIRSRTPQYYNLEDDSVQISKEAHEADRVAASLRGYKATLAEEIDKLALGYRAIWELFRVKKGLSEDDLHTMVRELDLRDGLLDGKVRIPPKKCSKCGRVVSQRHLRCMYCGSQELEDSPFDSV